MSGNVVIDTNIFIYLTKGDINVIDYIQDKKIFISFITELEILSFKNITLEEEQIIQEILSQFFIFNFDDALKKHVIYFRKKYNLKLPDSIIVATARINNIPLFTSDKKLNNIEEIDVILYDI
jgi:hypothetical protein